MLDHLLFNSQKWFAINDNADSVTANGKDYEAVPQQVKIPKNTKINLFNSFGSMDTRSERYAASDTVLNCIGVIGENYCCSGEIELNRYGEPDEYGGYGTKSTIDLSGSKNKWVNENYSICVIPKSQVQVVKWGGKSLIVALYQRFKALTTRKVVGAWQ